MVRTQAGSLAPRPEWADSLSKNMKRGYVDFQKVEFVPPPPREEIDTDFLRVEVVFRENDDVIFQLFPKTKAFPKDSRLARTFLAEALEAHFGDTTDFEGGYTPELESWAIKAKGLQQHVSYAPEHHIHGFVQLLAAALAELE